MIRMVDVMQHYGLRPILRHINLEVRAGELMALVGPNGMGKSTMLSTMAGLIAPKKGYVEIDGLRRRASVDAERQIRERVFYLPDHPWLPVHASGRAYALAVGRIYDVEEERLMDHVERLLKVFHLDKQADSAISSYSAGQKKKIALCAAFAAERPIYIMDEPFSGGLDPSGILALKRLMGRLAERDDVTVVMATPVPEILEDLAHRVAVLSKGEIFALDTVENLKAKADGASSLEEALERLLNPHTLALVDEYLAEMQ
jgi:ABC-type multidrug transport system ATPase subunit